MANINKKSSPPVPQLRTRLEENELGEIQISDDVISSVVRRYTLQVPGVVRLVGQSIVGGLANIIGKKIQDRAIRVDMSADHVDITLNVIVRFGEHVPTVATNIQSVCRKYVEELTGKQVGRVNVIIQNLDEDESLDTSDEPDK